MSRPIDELMQNDANTSVYEEAVATLRELSREGFKQSDAENLVMLPMGDSELPSKLVGVAAYMVNPEIKVRVNEDNTQLCLQFPKTFTKPPVRAMREKLDELKSNLFECIVKHPEGPDYSVIDPGILPINPALFALSFALENEPSQCFYRLPSNMPFIDKEGQRHSNKKLVNEAVMQEYIVTHEPHLQEEGVAPVQVIIAPQTMQRMLDEMHMAPLGRQH